MLGPCRLIPRAPTCLCPIFAEDLAVNLCHGFSPYRATQIVKKPTFAGAHWCSSPLTEEEAG